jgi:hypothetical protein
VSALESRLSESLQEALREILRVERSLVEAGDRRMLARFGNPAHGAEIASRLGYTLLATDEARLVDQLTFLPNSQALIREFLQMASAPRMWEVARIAAEGAAQSQGGGLKTQRPATIVATTCASRSSQGSRSSTTRSAA